MSGVGVPPQAVTNRLDSVRMIRSCLIRFLPRSNVPGSDVRRLRPLAKTHPN
jgi:hypothetical protein